MEHFIADDGEEIRLRISGDGPPLVLLHEWASGHRVWEPFVQRLGSYGSPSPVTAAPA